jgi:1,4-dihydroxy-2-naphthoate octaprenyltransferase
LTLYLYALFLKTLVVTKGPKHAVKLHTSLLVYNAAVLTNSYTICQETWHLRLIMAPLAVSMAPLAVSMSDGLKWLRAGLIGYLVLEFNFKNRY